MILQDQEPQASADITNSIFGTQTGGPQKASSARTYKKSPSALGPHERLRAQVMRAHAALYADENASLSLVSRSALGRAVSTFLSEVALQGSLGGSFSRTVPASTETGTPGRKVGQSEAVVKDLQERRNRARSRKHYNIH